MAKEMKVKFRLNHTCNREGCKGDAGDILDVSPTMAADMVARGGGEILGGPSITNDEQAAKTAEEK